MKLVLLRGCCALLVFLTGMCVAVVAQTAATKDSPTASAASANAKTNSSPRAESLLIFPFENSGHDPNMDWLGEGLAELATERLAGQGAIVFSRRERLAALEKMGLPAYAPFSRATMVKIAAEIDADYVLFGEFVPDGKGLHVSARVLALNPPSLSDPLTESGTLDSLNDLQARISWEVLCRISERASACNPSSSAAVQFVNGARRLAPGAIEFFVRGVQNVDDEARLRDLREASRLEPEWDEPLMAIGRTYYSRRDCDSALAWLARVPAGSGHAVEAEFDSGVCQLLRNDPPRAEALYAELKSRAIASPGAAEILNNLGAALLREARYEEAAAEFDHSEQLDPGEPDYWFNAGLSRYLLADWSEASRALREAIRLQPDSAEMRGLLAAVLDKTGNADEAARLRQSDQAAAGSEGSNSDTKKQDVTKMSPTALARLARVRTDLNSGAVR